MTYQIVSERRLNNPVTLKSPSDAYNLVKRYGDAPKEQFIVITLNGGYVPVSVVIVTMGLVNRTIVHPREVFIRAIQDMASAIIICHNHPSGSLKASNEDIEITERMCEAGKLLGINVIDHIIFSKTGFVSLRKECIFENWRINEQY